MSVNARRLGPGDEATVDLCVAIGVAKYPRFDAVATAAWGKAALDRSDVAIFVTKNCFAVAATYQRFWSPSKLYADLLLLCSGRDDRRSAGQLLALARAVKEWAIDRGCVRLDFSAETVSVDLGPLARRLGSARQQSAYMIELGAGR